MIILLTGKPGVGKSTVIEKFIGLNSEPANWVVTKGIPRPQGDRGGFAATNSDGVQRIISHKTDIDSDVIVGENHVDIAAVDEMFSAALETAIRQDDSLTIVDEIGPIQLLSPAFAATLQGALNGTSDIVATIHYSDERLEIYRKSANTLLLDVTLRNRDMMPEALLLMVSHRTAYNALTPERQQLVFEMLRQYVANAQSLQVEKLLANAIGYVQDGAVTKISSKVWSVVGRHGQYRATLHDSQYNCECDLANGRREYSGRAGVCSHVQSVVLSFIR